MRRTAIINIVGLSERHIGEHTPNISQFRKATESVCIKPVLPALTCTAQSTYLTGKLPNEHGIVANGWYNRELCEHQFWKQSNKLVKGEKLWEIAKRSNSEFTCAKLFWWYNMYSSADFSITPRPMYPADGRKIFDVYTHPMNMREAVKNDLGEFPFPYFWGPMAGLPSSQWIAASAKWVEEKHQPTLNLIYLPHLDYNLQRIGPDDKRINDDLQAIDKIVGELIDFFQSRNIAISLLSEYGITPVNNPVHLNRLFRKKGWITIKDELGLEMLDCGASKAFAIADHQIAHIYINDTNIQNEIKQALEKTEGIEAVYDSKSKNKIGLDHPNSGDLIAIANENSWFTYYYWLDDALAPDFARCVDIHRKIGYDPVELFIDPKLLFPKLKIISKLIKKKLGFRMLMDVIPLDASLVQGSHGRIPENQQDWPILIGPIESLAGEKTIDATSVHEKLLKFATADACN